MTLIARLALLLCLTAPLQADPIPDCGLGPWGLCRYLEPSGQPLTQPRFQQAQRFSGGLAAVQMRGLWGYVGDQGQMVIPPRYLAAAPFRHGLAEVVTPKGTRLITLLGEAVPLPRVRRAIPVSATTVMTYADDPATRAPELWRDPQDEVPYVDTTARLYNLTTGWIDTPPLRRITLIPGATDTFWFQIAEPGPTWDRYDWGLMRDDGTWLIPPGILDLYGLPGGLTLTYDPPNGQRQSHDSNFGFELDRNSAGFEAVVDAEGHIISGQISDTGVTTDDRPLVQQGGAWFLIDAKGTLTPYPRQPVRVSFRVRTLKDPAMSVHTVALTCPGGLQLFTELGGAQTMAQAQTALWGIRDAQGQVLIPPTHPVITCPQNGVALVPDLTRRQWCPVSPLPQADNPANCQRFLWDGWITESSGTPPLDPDPFQAQILFWQNKLLAQAYPDLSPAKPRAAQPAKTRPTAPQDGPPNHSPRPHRRMTF